MTKDEFINLIRGQKDIEFLTSIVETALKVMPRGFRDNLIYELYAENIYEGKIIILTHTETNRRHVFMSIGETNDFLKTINVRHKPTSFYTQKSLGNTIYGYKIEQIDTTLNR